MVLCITMDSLERKIKVKACGQTIFLRAKKQRPTELRIPTDYLDGPNLEKQDQGARH